MFDSEPNISLLCLVVEQGSPLPTWEDHLGTLGRRRDES